jgi:hypothetical protein
MLIMGNKQEEIAKWSKLYGRQISEHEYDEIRQNLSNFFDLLHKWDQEKQAKSENK